MRSIIFKAPDESIEGYAVRLEEDDPLEDTLGAVLSYYYAGENPDCTTPDRIDAISVALQGIKTGSEDLGHFDLTIDEATIAAESLAKNAAESLIQKGRRADESPEERTKRIKNEQILHYALKIKSLTAIKNIVERGFLTGEATADAYKGKDFFSVVRRSPVVDESQVAST